jgi:hypothetical protein
MSGVKRAWKVRCEETTATGSTCGRAAIKGGYVCLGHGGRDPDVRAEALDRYREFMGTAFEEFEVRQQERTEERRDEERRNRELIGKQCPDPAHAMFELYVTRRYAEADLGLNEESRWCYTAEAWHNVPAGRFGVPGRRSM